MESTDSKHNDLSEAEGVECSVVEARRSAIDSNKKDDLGEAEYSKQQEKLKNLIDTMRENDPERYAKAQKSGEYMLNNLLGDDCTFDSLPFIGRASEIQEELKRERVDNLLLTYKKYNMTLEDLCESDREIVKNSLKLN